MVFFKFFFKVFFSLGLVRIAFLFRVTLVCVNYPIKSSVMNLEHEFALVP